MILLIYSFIYLALDLCASPFIYVYSIWSWLKSCRCIFKKKILYGFLNKFIFSFHSFFFHISWTKCLSRLIRSRIDYRYGECVPRLSLNERKKRNLNNYFESRFELNAFEHIWMGKKVMKWSIHPRIRWFFFYVVSLPSFSLKSVFFLSS